MAACPLTITALLFFSMKCVRPCVQEAMSMLDVLICFAAFPTSADEPTCRPELVPAMPGASALLHLSQLWHPCAVASSGSTGSIVPNDLCLGGRCCPCPCPCACCSDRSAAGCLLCSACCSTSQHDGPHHKPHVPPPRVCLPQTHILKHSCTLQRCGRHGPAYLRVQSNP